MQNEISYTAAAKLIRGLGFRVSRDCDGEIRVGFPGNESAAYYTDCPADALGTARDMRARADAGAVPVADPEGEAVESGDHVAGEPWDGPESFELSPDVCADCGAPIDPDRLFQLCDRCGDARDSEFSRENVAAMLEPLPGERKAGDAQSRADARAALETVADRLDGINLDAIAEPVALEPVPGMSPRDSIVHGFARDRADAGAVPATLNGFPVLYRRSRLFSGSESESFRVIADLGEASAHRYVVATWNRNCGDSWVWGDYFADLPGALASVPGRWTRHGEVSQ